MSPDRSRLIRMGLHLPDFRYPAVAPHQLFEAVAATAVAAEASGFDSVFIMDHFVQLPALGGPESEIFEAYTLLSAIAARTSSVRLGCMVGGMTYRNPALLAKTVTSLDVISGGRAIWGIGAGWYEEEHDSYNVPFGTFTDRFEKLEEGVQLVKSMFVNKTTTFDGKWFRTTGAYNEPKPVQPGGPPVLIGGSGEKKTLRMVAEYADACNVMGGPAVVRRLMNVLDEHCERVGRDPGEICRTRLTTLVVGRTVEEAEAKVDARFGEAFAQMPVAAREQARAGFIVGDAAAVQEQVQTFLDCGLDGMVFNLLEFDDVESVVTAAEVLRPVLG